MNGLAWLILLAAPLDPIESVALTLARGTAAEASGDAAGMLDAARQMEAIGGRAAEGEPDLAQHWRALARSKGAIDNRPAYRGRALGPAYRRGLVAPGAAVATEQVFLAGRKAVVSLLPDKGGALSMRVAAPEREICASPPQPQRSTCAWLPLFTTRVKISVANPGRAPAAYFLVSN